MVAWSHATAALAQGLESGVILPVPAVWFPISSLEQS